MGQPSSPTLPEPAAPAQHSISSLFAAELLKLRKMALLRRVPAGEAVFSEGDPADALYLLERGTVTITTQIEAARGRLITRIQPGDYFGEMALLDDGPRSATAVAETESLVARIPKADVLELIRSSPPIAFAMLREFGRRIRTTNHQMVEEIISGERNGLLGRFGLWFAHDLKNPLAGISMAAELLADETIPGDLRQNLSRQLVRQARRVATMTEEMLAISRGTRPELRLQATDLGQFFASKLEELRIDFRPRHLEIFAEGPPPPLVLPLDPARIEQLFLNLLHNSADAMPEGGRAWFSFSTTGGRLVVQLEDSGPGIGSDKVEKIFEPFFTLGKAKGTGIGLSICRRVMEGHGGTIRALSHPGRGAVFRMEFPLPL